jgi:predicted GNAT family N-acyltransferase
MALQDQENRPHIVRVLSSLSKSAALERTLSSFQVSSKVLDCQTEHDWDQEVAACLDTHLTIKTNAAVLLSDLLTHGGDDEPPVEPELSVRAKAWLDRYRDLLFATIAVTPSAQKVVDIDRTVPRLPSADLLLKTLQLVTCRLQYLAKPVKSSSVTNVEPRTIRSRNQTEFQDYFRLRHTIYVPMGYLPRRIEQCSSRLDMDWCDMKAIHIGAYARHGPQQRLIGTARVITTRAVSPQDEQFYRRIAGRDEVLQQELGRPLLLGLPIFESQDASNEIMTDILLRNLQCGELSRVIVAPAYRGAGISEQLIRRAQHEAIKDGLYCLFLECLDIHDRVYAKRGFVRVPTMRGKVVGADRTMIVMQWICDPPDTAAHVHSK